MKTTNSKDSVKVNQILPIMQDHFGQNMNLARIKLMALLLETAREFDPFGHAGFDPSGIIRLTP